MAAAAGALAAGPGVEPGEWHGGWLRIAIALVLAGQGMAFSLAINLSEIEGPPYWFVHGGLLASALAVLALLGGPLLRESIATVRAGRIAVDLLFLVTLSGALAVSIFSSFRGSGPVFYELVAILLAIYTTGKLLGARSRAKALRAVEQLRGEYDTCSLLAADGTTRRVAAGAVEPGDRVLIAAGETVAVDGVVRTGEALVETTPLSGEPEPAARGPGDAVFAGMRSVDGALVVEVTAAGGARRLDAILREIENARLRPSRLQAAADRLAARFVPLVVAVSAATGAWWLWRGGLDAAVVNGLAVLVVACPCALGLATPLGIWAGLAQLGRLGVIARSGDFLEALAGADAAIFDKTGTLCEPELQVTRFVLLPDSPLSDPELRAALAAAESGVRHPVAEALRSAAAADGAKAGAAFALIEARVVPGGGIRARVSNRGGGRVHEILAGDARLLAGAAGVAVDDAATGTAGRRQVHVAVDGRCAARIEFDERPQARAAAVFAELRALGLSVEILTGDAAFSAALWPGVPRRAGVTPEEKAAHVRARQTAGARVLFVGDGLNDAAALATADASVAIRSGADLARGNALAVVAGESLGTLPAAIRLARRVRAAIGANLRFAAIYNTAGMGIAAAGMLHPVLAALLMAGSSAIVSARVLRAAGADAPARE